MAPHGQAHFVFSNHKANAKKPKELALPHHYPRKKTAYSKVNYIFANNQQVQKQQAKLWQHLERH